MELVDHWAEYFSQYSKYFDILPRRDNAMGSTQALYKRFTGVTLQNHSMLLDFKEVDSKGVKELDLSFYINVKNEFIPKCDKSLEISIYKAEEEFTTYKVRRLDSANDFATINFTRRF